MARRRRRSKAGPPNAPGLNGVEELRGELESLKAELSSAQAEASEREQSPRRSRRRVAIAAGMVTAGAGVTAGVLLSEQGSQSRVAAPVTAAPSTHSSAPRTQPTAPAPTSPATTPITTPPATTVPSPAPGNTAGGLVIVQPGQSFWSIAQAVETQSSGRVATTAEVTRYWLAVVAANASRLPRPGDPNLLYIGQRILLPPI
ncbi:MAG TPA: hypothetical protein VFZ97_09190 [Acidimicrobiales bacterium]